MKAQLLNLILLLCISMFKLDAFTPMKWVVYYQEDLPVDALAPYSLVVLEADNHKDTGILLENGKQLLGYISLGEISDDRAYFKKFESEGVLLEQNPNWPSRMIDVRNKKWTKFVIEELIPRILFKHYSGVFLDTVDNAGYLEDKDPVKYKGMKAAMIQLIKTIRMHYPTIKIMMNRGFELLPQLARTINYELAENILVEYDFSEMKSHFVPQEEYLNIVSKLNDAKKINPQLEIFTLDYWDPLDKEGIKKIYSLQKEQKFNPYVSTIELDQIIPEPN